MKRVRPAMTQSSPTRMLPRFGKGYRNTTIWKNAMTMTIGARSRKAPAVRRMSTARALAAVPGQPHRVSRTELRSRRWVSALTRLNSGVSPIGYSVAMGPAALSAPYSRLS